MVGTSAGAAEGRGSDSKGGARQRHGAAPGRERRRQGARGADDPSDSPRSRERFVQVNCAAIPEDLIESELFGHEKGSFTGATERQMGKFEQADRGTIFLDEVGDMSLKTQAKVLRVLQEGEVERLGSAKTAKVDVRVIAATNKNLEEEIEKGQFREDLYFRLAVIPIYVPPLRERPEDIPLLVKHFLNLLSRENNLRPKQITPAAMDALKRYRWRGNIRELRNTVERLIIMSRAERRSTSPICPSRSSPTKGRATSARPPRAAPAAMPSAGADAGTLRAVQGIRRARVSRREASRERVEHLEDRRGDRHAAQQPLQEARAVRHPAGDGRIRGYDGGVAVGQMIACCKARGKSELRRAVRRVTPGQGDLKDQWHRKYTALSEARKRRVEG